jgi:phospholipid/cholesterol/gamma-HCH transport system substrate-binding protein
VSEPISKIKVGTFVIAGVALFITSIIMFSGTRSFLHSYTSFHIRFRSTQGLAKGSVVSLSGMDVGNVQEIKFDDDSSMNVRVDVLAEVAKRITAGSVASIRTQGALGDKYIYLSPGVSSDTPLAPGADIKTETQQDFLEMITSGKGPDLSVVLATVKEFNQLLNSLNSNDRLVNLIDNVAKASQGLAKLSTEPNIQGSFLHLKNVLQKIDDGTGTLGLLINDPALHDRLMNLLGDEPRNRYLKPLLREAIKQNEQTQRAR